MGTQGNDKNGGYLVGFCIPLSSHALSQNGEKARQFSDS